MMKTFTIAQINYKFVLLSLLFLLLSLMSVNAQKLQVGVVAGATASQLSWHDHDPSVITNVTEGNRFVIAPSAGLFAEVPLPFKTSVRVEALYTQKGGNANIERYKYSELWGTSSQEVFNYIDVPVSLNYHVMDRIKLSAGGYVSILHSGTATYSNTYLDGGFPREGFNGSFSGEEIRDFMPTVDYGLLAGAGARLTNNLSLDLTYKHGLVYSHTIPASRYNSTLMLGLSVGIR